MYTLQSYVPYKSNRLYAYTASILIGAVGAIHLVFLLTEFVRVAVYSGTTPDEIAVTDEASMLDVLDYLVGLPLLPCFILAVIFYCLWLYRANYNLRALGNLRPEFLAGWAVGWFFIPIGHLVMPYNAVREIWILSDPLIKEPTEGWQKPGSSSLVGFWWVFWLLANFSLSIYSNFALNSMNADIAFIFQKFNIIARSFLLVATVLAIMVVIGIEKRQQARYKLVEDSKVEVPSPPIFDQPSQ